MENVRIINQTSAKPSFKIYFLILSIILIWGLSWPVSKIGLAYISPCWFVAGRLIIGTITMFLIVAGTGKLALPQKADLPIIFVIGFLQITLFMLFVNLGLNYVDAGRSAILVYTTPILIIPITILFFDERVTVFQWIGCFLGLLGILILFAPWAVDWADRLSLLHNGYLLMAALCWAVSMLCARNMTWAHEPMELMPWQLLVATIPTCLLAWFTEPLATTQWNLTLIECLIYSGILATSLGYWGVVVVSKELPSSKASLCFLGVPVFGYFSSAIILHEPITLTTVLAVISILLGLILAAINKQGNTKAKR